MTQIFNENIFKVGRQSFNQYAIDIFHFQYQHNPVYRNFSDSLRVIPEEVKTIFQIPFLPIDLFKSFPIQTTIFNPEIIFESSGTTQSVPSRHYVKDLSIYRNSYLRGFEKFYGPVDEWCVIGLLPSYLERDHSSLVTMVDDLIRMSHHPGSGFYLYEYDQLFQLLTRLEKEHQKTWLIGVTFALVDFAEKFSMKLNNTVVMETGGMKGRQKEITRAALHSLLKERLGLNQVHSEYGMTELLSQAYSKSNGIFESVPWMKTLVRNDDDPREVHESGEGILNIIDLANIFSCSFIATEDVGRIDRDGMFEVLGRTDNSDIRGCSLLAI
jgi:phenylacetate-coenzyme A ligase PaaK-like adenylate-forming protein